MRLFQGIRCVQRPGSYDNGIVRLITAARDKQQRPAGAHQQRTHPLGTPRFPLGAATRIAPRLDPNDLQRAQQRAATTA